MSMRHSISVIAVVLLSSANAVSAQDRSKPEVELNPPPSTAQKYTAPIPGTGGYVWGSGQNSLAPPNSKGGSIGLQYPPDKGPTKTFCNGKPC
jgi:hypothetical protein